MRTTSASARPCAVELTTPGFALLMPVIVLAALVPVSTLNVLP